jgi:hypothetical protein
MPALTVPLTGDDLLAAVTEAMVALHERYHHRKPVTAKTLRLGDELLACVLEGVYGVEKTMIDCSTPRSSSKPAAPSKARRDTSSSARSNGSPVARC